MGLIALKTAAQQPNLTPEWTGTPGPSWTEGVGGTYNLNNYVNDPDGDELVFVLNVASAPLPTGVTLSADGIFTATSSVVEGTTTDIIVDIYDGENPPVSSPNFSISITVLSALIFPLHGNGRIGSRNWGDDPTRTGSNSDKDPDEVARLAQGDFTIINGRPNDPGRRAAISDFCESVKAINPNHLVFQYFIFQESSDDLSGARHDMIDGESGPPGQYINPSDEYGYTNDSWYARDDDGNLEIVFGTYPNGSFAVNITDNVVPNTDTAEDRYFGELFIDTVWLEEAVTGSGYTEFIPDGWFIDVFDYCPREDALNYSGLPGADNANSDWNVPGRSYNVASQYRAGQARGVNRIYENHPGKYVIGNIITWPREYSGEDPTLPLNEDGDVGVYKEYANLLEGGWIEGQTRSPNAGGTFAGYCGMRYDGAYITFGTPRMAMNNYLYCMRHTKGLKLVLNQWSVEVSSIPSDRIPIVGTHMTSAAAALARFGITQTLMDNGYACVQMETSTQGDPYNNTTLWDELGTCNTGTTGLAGPKWLGPATEAPLSERETALGGPDPWLAGPEIYKREFQNGAALNRWDKPSGLSTGDPIPNSLYYIPIDDAAVDFSGGTIPGNAYKLITGVQDSAINTGQTINETNFPLGLPLRVLDGRVLEKL